MKNLMHKGFKFEIIRSNGVYTVIQITPKPTNGDEFIKVKNSMFDSLQSFVDDNY